MLGIHALPQHNPLKDLYMILGKHFTLLQMQYHIEGLMQDSSIFIANTLEILQSSIKTSILNDNQHN